MGKTRGVHETTPEIRNRMVGMYEAGLGLRDIAAAVNCSQRTVKRWLNRFDKEGNVETRDRCGRKRATTQEQDEAIIRLATQTPITAAKAVLPALGLNCSVDTVRERLHKAGIHNWTPCKKHIQKIPIADGSGIQQAVWRPTGTQLGKKKGTKEASKTKINNPQPKKKSDSRKTRSKSTFEDDGAPSETIEQTEVQPNFSFSSSVQNEQAQSQTNELQTLQPPPLPVITNDPNQYSYPLNLIPQPQPLYHHHPGLDVSQSWPLDLVRGDHHYAQAQQNSIHHEQHPITSHIPVHPQLNNHHDTQPSQHFQEQIQPSINQGKLNESQDVIINVCSDVCSNSNSSSNENNQSSCMGDEDSSNSGNNKSKKKKTRKIKNKKGGKVKGTLETSVEIRNRMIGMSEAGLSTLSIALAINRSERTVKRWLDRWYKEGNVQTKERKGRRRITTKEQDEAIVAMATQNPLTAARYVAPALGLKCSVDTIRERLHKAGIHSWKLGKKQGEGNIVHTVHLWQPSGNRTNKVKNNGDRKKKFSSRKRNQNSDRNTKQSSKKQKIKTPLKDTTPPSTNIIPNEANMQYQNHSQPSTMIQPTHNLSSSPTVLTQEPTQLPSTCTQPPTLSQTSQVIGPIMQQRSDCRLALSAIVPSIPNQPSASIAYPSCMMGNTGHTGHMEQADPMNYEPYIWSF